MDMNYYKQYEPIWGAWHIKGLIGEGSFGKVYEIEREDFGVTYKAALKALTIPQSQSEIKSIMADGMDEASVTAYFRQFVEEIVGEFQLMSKLKATNNIVSYEDHIVVKRTEGIGWDILIRMELLTSLIDHIRNTKLARKDIIQLGIDMCRALELCQKYNIIHRDIKPENIFISDNGNYKLGDFGIARTVEKTTSGLSKKGTYTYMAPEIYRGEAYGSSVDIYSLGIVMYRLLNENRTPFLPAYPAPITHNDREAANMKRISDGAIPQPLNADGRLAEIVLKACAYKSKDRYSSPMQMREELEAILYDEKEAKIIYPKGDDTPIKSIDYVDTGDEVPEILSEDRTDVLISDVKSDTAEKTEGIFGDRKNAKEKTESILSETAFTEGTTGFNKTESFFGSKPTVPPKRKKSIWKDWKLYAAASCLVLLFFGYWFFTRPSVPESLMVSADQIVQPVVFMIAPNEEPMSSETIDNFEDIILNRLNAFGQKYSLERKNDTLQVSMEKSDLGSSDSEILETINLLCTKGELTFKDANGNILLNNDDISEVKRVKETKSHLAGTMFEFTEDGRNKVFDFTSQLLGERVSIFLDEMLISEPQIQSAIDNGELFIASDDKSFVLLPIIINLGKLPCEITYTIDESSGIAVPSTPEPTPVIEEWRLEGYEEVEPYKEYERKYVNDEPTDETRYTGNTKPQEQPAAPSGGTSNRGGSTGGNTGGNSSNKTTGGNSGGTTGGNSSGNNGGAAAGNSGGSENGGSTGGNSGGNSGGTTGGNSGGDNSGGTTGGNNGGESSNSGSDSQKPPEIYVDFDNR